MRMLFIARIARLLIRWPKEDVQTSVLRHWANLASGMKSVYHLREFEDEMWERGFRLAATPFEHHLSMMRLLRDQTAPKLDRPRRIKRSNPPTTPSGLG
ncbi:MAG: hypothetical protein JWP29_5538 [Rhodoferax sp.]|nr:hypothetical protein [Rhodoferax sp.]